MSAFRDLLRAHRAARSLTQEQLAERAGISAKAVSALERGERRRPYRHTVDALADALDLDSGERAALRDAVPHVPPVDTAGEASRIPEPAGAVFGREDQTAAVVALLGSASRRVVTLTGPGGVGKTTLALLVARAAGAAFSGGVVVVELADVAEPDAVVPAVADALGLSAARIDTVAALVPALAGRRLLLVLDNLEHLLDCGPGLAELVARCPELVVLATSRAALRVRAEREVRVAPLGADAAARMFGDRALAAGAALDGDPRTAEVVRALCERADGLPLALELAASAAALVGPAALLERLDVLPGSGPQDLPARQRSMTATLEWSLELLSEPARGLLRRLSVCRGGFSLDTAQRIGDPEPVLPALAELVRHALVGKLAPVEGVERFRLLEPVRQFAADRCDPAERVRAAGAVTEAMVTVARTRYAELRDAGQARALHLLDADLGNLRLAVDHLLACGRADDAAELLWRIWLYLAIRGHGRNGTDWALRIAEHPLTERGRVHLLLGWSGTVQLIDPQQAFTLSQEAITLGRTLGDDVLVAEAHLLAVSTALYVAEPAATLRLCTETLQVVRALDDPFMITHALLSAGQFAVIECRLDEGDVVLREAEEISRRVGADFETGAVLTTRAVLAELEGAYTEAAGLLAEAIGIAAAIRNGWTLAYMLSALAGVAVRLGDHVAGARLFGAWTAYAAEHAVVADHPVSSDLVRRDLAEARAALGPDGFETERRTGRDATIGDLVEWAHAVELHG